MTLASGIDLGTTFCKSAWMTAVGRPEDLPNDIGATTTPSAILFTPDGEIVFGQEALNSRLLEPSGFVTGWKREIGNSTWRFRAPDGKEHSAKDLMVRALSAMLAFAERRTGERVTHVSLPVPANFNDGQRREMLDVGRDAGVEVLSLINEPTAASLSYALEKRPNRMVLVYDLGGGTFDVTLLLVESDHVEVLATDGIPRCGGNDLLQVLEEHCLDHFEREHGLRPTAEEYPTFRQELSLACERGKIALSGRHETVITTALDGRSLIGKVSRDTYEALARPILQPTIAQCEAVLQAGGADWGNIDVVLVGGASRMPLVKELLRQASGKAPLADVDPDHVVARGAAIEAALRLKEVGESLTAEGVEILPPSIGKTDVSAHHLGCLAISQRTGELHCVVIIERNTPLPAERFDVFGLQEQGQPQAEILVVQGERGARPEACHEIGRVLLDLDPLGPMDRRVRVAYRYDESGVVHVVATDTFNGNHATIDLELGGHAQASAA